MGAVYEAKVQRLGNRVALKQTIVSRAQLQRALSAKPASLPNYATPPCPS
jgi:hypothetical protein